MVRLSLSHVIPLAHPLALAHPGALSGSLATKVSTMLAGCLITLCSLVLSYLCLSVHLSAAAGRLMRVVRLNQNSKTMSQKTLKKAI